MATDYPARHDQLTAGLREMSESAPAVMDAFGRLHRSAITDGALSSKTKELMALAIAVAIQCDGCIAFHARDALKAGATAEEIDEALGVAVLMGGGPAAVYATDARRAVAEFRDDLAGSS
jgi:AhpD family alkylhydroperoxidase